LSVFTIIPPHAPETSTQLEQIAARCSTRGEFLTELTLDPPDASGAQAGEPHLDEDYLILSTIHSAKGQEWDAVFVPNLVDGCIPSDMATGKPDQIDEERRLRETLATTLALGSPTRRFEGGLPASRCRRAENRRRGMLWKPTSARPNLCS
jgi:DNA helicase II / ATP-dependent DNA helicase PcrA